MENNLDDILVDSPEGQEKQEKSKRKVLIAVASALLIAVVISVIYFATMKKEEPMGLEETHNELEKFTKPEFAPKSKEDEEFDRLIADIKAKHPDPNQQISKPVEEKIQGSSKQETKDNLSKKDALIESKIAEMVKSSQEESQVQFDQKFIKQEAKKIDQIPNIKESEKQGQKKVQKEANKHEKQIKTQQKRIKQVEQKEIKTKKQESRPQEKKTPNTASQTFNSLGIKIPQGFYLQVGVFTNKPNAKFLQQISNFPYKVEKLDQNGRVVKRYLIGPFASKDQAQERMQEVLEKVTKPIIIEVR